MRFYQIYNLCKAIARGCAGEELRCDIVSIKLTSDEYLQVVKDSVFNIPHNGKEFTCLGVRIYHDAQL